MANKTSPFIGLLKKHYPNAHCALNHKNSFELLIATILSAQCTDERVNIVTKELFTQFPDPESMSKASINKLEDLVRSTGFYKNKAKNILSCSFDIVSRFHGEIPKTLEDLTSLAGVGRKTANVVLGNAFGIASGIVVDTHVQRLSYRMGLTRAKGPEKIELDLIKQVPKKNWIVFSHWLITHGRAVCKARKPDCIQCFLKNLCPKRGVQS
jgi:endonuclease-3